MRNFFFSIIKGQTLGAKCQLLGSGPLRFPLIILSFIYAGCVVITRFLYKINLLKSVKIKSKVISVGNITWGGTGKTSLVMHISRYLRRMGKDCAILIRGYGSDEDIMLKKVLTNTVILSGKNRVKNAQIEESEHGIKIFILDDGFQHWRLRRDLDIVAISATNPFGNRHILPAGILREPLSALKRADAIIITKTNLADDKAVSGIKNDILSINANAEIYEAEYLPTSVTEIKSNIEHKPDFISAKSLCAVAAVGDNETFFEMLTGLGVKITEKFSYMDHHRFSKKDIGNISKAAKNTEAIITTAKDWVRLKGKLSCNVLLLNVAMKLKDEQKFFKRISTVLGS